LKFNLEASAQDRIDLEKESSQTILWKLLTPTKPALDLPIAPGLSPSSQDKEALRPALYQELSQSGLRFSGISKVSTDTAQLAQLLSDATAGLQTLGFQSVSLGVAVADHSQSSPPGILSPVLLASLQDLFTASAPQRTAPGRRQGAQVRQIPLQLGRSRHHHPSPLLIDGKFLNRSTNLGQAPLRIDQAALSEARFGALPGKLGRLIDPITRRSEPSGKGCQKEEQFIDLHAQNVWRSARFKTGLSTPQSQALPGANSTSTARSLVR